MKKILIIASFLIASTQLAFAEKFKVLTTFSRIYSAGIVDGKIHIVGEIENFNLNYIDSSLGAIERLSKGSLVELKVDKRDSDCLNSAHQVASKAYKELTLLVKTNKKVERENSINRQSATEFISCLVNDSI
ncbi:MAG: hypothetical protein H6621_11895 [Halobacteriovoraceae bacterium]|nr:hypothetical protein [Halobacteriovoraceae bacterium]MCB9095763.1 hypothetical protein [Halobacteriovoraceae bacterium]